MRSLLRWQVKTCHHKKKLRRVQRVVNILVFVPSETSVSHVFFHEFKQNTPHYCWVTKLADNLDSQSHKLSPKHKHNGLPQKPNIISPDNKMPDNVMSVVHVLLLMRGADNSSFIQRIIFRQSLQKNARCQSIWIGVDDI